MRNRALLGLCCALLAAACGPSGQTGYYDGIPDLAGPEDSAQPGDGGGPDVTNPYIDASGDSACGAGSCPMPVADGCGATEICDNGSDDNCDGQVDEGCACTPGSVQACFLGPPGRRGVGACTDGNQLCQGSEEFGSWGPCQGGLWPSPDQCDTVDNDCNGCTDDNPACCTVELSCPSTMPEAAPYTDYPIDGTMFYPGPVTSWSWTVEGGPCDQLLFATSGATSYTLTGATSSTLHFHPTLSGDYTITVNITATDGTVYTCTFIVHVRGPGLRVEACWDTTGSSDVDLHLHKPGTTTNWFADDVSGTNINSDDCYYYNCKAEAYGTFAPPCFTFGSDQAQWGNASSAIAECSGSPEGACWTSIGSCHNPRLDIDNIATVGIPENINVDNPADGQTFRTMVHYYGGSVTTHPMVNIYCGGNLVATYGAAPDTVAGFNSGGGFASGIMWRVADMLTHVDATGTTTGCDVTALHPPGMVSGYWTTTNDISY